jgi:hypothetical protein
LSLNTEYNFGKKGKLIDKAVTRTSSEEVYGAFIPVNIKNVSGAKIPTKNVPHLTFLFLIRFKQKTMIAITR